jgi:hypothetical protein
LRRGVRIKRSYGKNAHIPTRSRLREHYLETGAHGFPGEADVFFEEGGIHGGSGQKGRRPAWCGPAVDCFSVPSCQIDRAVRVFGSKE